MVDQVTLWIGPAPDLFRFFGFAASGFLMMCVSAVVLAMLAFRAGERSRKLLLAFRLLGQTLLVSGALLASALLVSLSVSGFAAGVADGDAGSRASAAVAVLAWMNCVGVALWLVAVVVTAASFATMIRRRNVNGADR